MGRGERVDWRPHSPTSLKLNIIGRGQRLKAALLTVVDARRMDIRLSC